MIVMLQDKFRGVLLGMACGDALGAQVEFKCRGTFPWQREFTGKGPHNLEPGQWTDDTAMALILATHLRGDPLLREPASLLNAWVRWWQGGEGSCTGRCFDIGNQTREGLNHWMTKGKAIKAKDGAQGNGALMRVAPVALTLYGDRGAVRAVAHAQALLTHPQPSAELCATFAAMVHDAAAREPMVAVEYLRKYNKPILQRKIGDVVSSGHDVATYEAALWCVMRSEGVEEAIVRAANLGDDADTVGAVTGALAGAVWGAEGLPERWLGTLAWRENITEMADLAYAGGRRAP